MRGTGALQKNFRWTDAEYRSRTFFYNRLAVAAFLEWVRLCCFFCNLLEPNRLQQATAAAVWLALHWLAGRGFLEYRLSMLALFVSGVIGGVGLVHDHRSELITLGELRAGLWRNYADSVTKHIPLLPYLLFATAMAVVLLACGTV